MIELGMFFLIEDKVCGCNSGTFSSSPSSIDHICVFKFVLYKQIYDETSTKQKAWKSNDPRSDFGWWKCMSIDSSIEDKGLSNCVHYQVQSS